MLTAESYSSDVIDFRSQLTKLFNENPDALLLAAQGEFSGGTIIKQAVSSATMAQSTPKSCPRPPRPSVSPGMPPPASRPLSPTLI